MSGIRILHTSDWHLGRSFGDHALLPHQEQFVDWLVDLTRSEAIDLVIVAGDLYDRSAPPADAVRLFSDALRRLLDTGARVVAISGNHDSAERIAALDGLVDAAGVRMRGGYGPAGQVTTLDTGSGPVALALVPFLDPLLAPAVVQDEIRSTEADDGNEAATATRRRRLTHEQVLGWALDRARAALPAGVPSVTVSHAFVTGGTTSKSERELSVGTADAVAETLFDGFDYVALGHLHRPQRIASRDRLRYSGSPLAYSFSEEHAKEVVLVDLEAGDAGTRCETRTIPVDVGRAVRTIVGAFDELLVGERVDDAWVRVELTDPAPVLNAHGRLRERFPHLVELGRAEREGDGGSAGPVRRAEVEQRRPIELAEGFWEDITGEAPTDDERALLEATLAGATRDPEP